MKREKFFIIFAYPGISGFLHTGHMRGYCYADFFARYKRLKDFYVFFPAGFHASGIPAIALAKKIRDKNEKIISYLKKEGLSDKEINKLGNINYLLNFFYKNYEETWKSIDLSINYETLVSTVDESYKKFIRWQMKKLKEKNLLYKGEYFSAYCLNCGPLAIDPSETDLSKGGNAERLEYFVVLFKAKGKDFYFATATIRPETIEAVSNIWIKKSKYIIAEHNSKKIILSKASFDFLKHQIDLKEIKEISHKELKELKAVNPINKKEVPVLYADFIDERLGTGVVMSVPAHAPFDFAALKDAKEKIEYHPIIEPYEDLEALFSEKNISYKDKKEIEILTKEIYKKENHKGKMSEKSIARGMPVKEAKEFFKNKLPGFKIFAFSEPVVCRCGEKAVIKRIKDQWFIKYSDISLKKKAHECIDAMIIKPEQFRKHFHDIIDWFNDRACTRKGSWLGTDIGDNWIVEPISDSVIYPAFYVISKYLNEKKITIDDLNNEFFDYVFLGKGSPYKEVYKEIRAFFDFIYGVDANLGGKEHKTVHFPVYVMAHCAIFDKEKWPKGIIVNGWLMGKNKSKISKSKGGAEPIPTLIKKYGSDAIRLFYASIAKAEQDAEWIPLEVENASKKIKAIKELLIKISKKDDNEENIADKWIISKLNKAIKSSDNYLNDFNAKDYSLIIFYELYHNISLWSKLSNNKKIAKEIIVKYSSLIHPVASRLSKELSNKFSFLLKWPEAGEEDTLIENVFDMAQKLKKDIATLKNLTKKNKLKIILSDPKKYEMLAKHGKNIKELFKEDFDKKELSMLAKHISKLKNTETSEKIEKEVLELFKKEFETEFNLEIEIIDFKSCDNEKRKQAMPLKPALLFI